MSAMILRFVAALALVNLPFWLLSQSFFLSRGLVNIESALAVTVMAFSAAAGLVLLALAWAADLVLSLSLTYHFGTPLEFLRSVRYASTLELNHYVNAGNAVLAVPFAAAAWGAVRLVRGQRAMWRGALLLTAALALADTLNGSSQLSDRGTWRLPFNLGGSPLVTLATQQIRHTELPPPVRLETRQTVQGLVDIPAWAAQHPDGSVLFVIVESLGLPRSPALRQWLDSQLGGLGAYDLRTADLPFRGSTTAGELRALCALSGSYRSIDAGIGAGCLPATLARQGWTTVGMHGFSSAMFDRKTWWPSIGLQQLHFVDSPLFADRPRCGAAFKGACDAQLIRQGMDALRPGRRFVYLLTLNTHLPLDAGPVPATLSRQCAREAVDEEACALVAGVGQVLNDLRTELQRATVTPLVVVLGDHAPPFALRDSREAFSAEKVPAYVLVPR
jgi:hypothetical protein